MQNLKTFQNFKIRTFFLTLLTYFFETKFLNFSATKDIPEIIHREPPKVMTFCKALACINVMIFTTSIRQQKFCSQKTFLVGEAAAAANTFNVHI